MSTDRAGWPPEPDDDLDRAFGPDTSSVPVRSGRQRVRRGLLVGGGVVLATGVLAVALVTIVGSVQNGVGGVFPQPNAALDRFDDAARAVTGVRSVDSGETTKTSFAAYDVAATVTVEPELSPDEQADVIDALSDAAGSSGGNGVRVYAVAELGTLTIGVSPNDDVTGKRLDLAREVDAIGGVRAVRCAWGSDDPSDDPADQHVTVETIGRGPALDAVLSKATAEAQRAFPGSTVSAERPAS